MNLGCELWQGHYANEYVSVSKNRNEAMVKAYASGGYTLKEVGEYFGLHYATVSRC